MDDPISRAADLIRASGRAVAFTGAGISAESGIPTYRGRGGLWSRHDPNKYASLDYFLHDPSCYWAFFRELRPLLDRARPNPGHVALAELESRGALSAVITQNIDGLHQAAGSARVLELHGTARRAHCMDCGRAFTIEAVFPLLAGDLPPRCAGCGGVLRPAVVFFGEALPAGVFEEAIAEARASDLVLAVGSSLTVYPAAAVPEIARSAGARILIVNVDPTPVDPAADLLFHDEAGRILPRILAALTQHRDFH